MFYEGKNERRDRNWPGALVHCALFYAHRQPKRAGRNARLDPLGDDDPPLKIMLPVEGPVTRNEGDHLRSMVGDYIHGVSVGIDCIALSDLVSSSRAIYTNQVDHFVLDELVQIPENCRANVPPVFMAGKDHIRERAGL